MYFGNEVFLFTLIVGSTFEISIYFPTWLRCWNTLKEPCRCSMRGVAWGLAMAWGFSTFFTGTGSMKVGRVDKRSICICTSHCQLTWLMNATMKDLTGIEDIYSVECKVLIKVERFHSDGVAQDGMKVSLRWIVPSFCWRKARRSVATLFVQHVLLRVIKRGKPSC